MQEVLTLFRQNFDHDGQARLCARHLELLRNDMGNLWWDYPKDERRRAPRRRSEDVVEGPWTREQIGLAGHLIRHAGESTDFHATVDFVTRAALEHIKAARSASKRVTTGSLRQWSLFTHEHMVPGQAVLRLITDVAHPSSQGDLQPLLAALSLRALVTGTKRRKADSSAGQEIDALDLNWASRLPEPSCIDGWNGPERLTEIPSRFYGLMRYEAARLLCELLPVSRRGRKVLADYYVYRGLSRENLQSSVGRILQVATD